MGDYSHYDYLNVEVSDDGIALITMNRPDKLNACTAEEHVELPRILADIAEDDDVKVGVVTGAGRAFSVGGDIKLLERAIDNPHDNLGNALDDGRKLVLNHIDNDKPMIAAVNGIAMGTGAVLALYCDVVIADRRAKIADGHIRAGIAAGDGGALLWPLTMGLTKAKRYLMTGDWITAEEAERCGLVTEVVDDGTCLDRAMEYARRFAAGPQTAIRYSKRAMNQWLRLGVAWTFDYSLALEGLTMVTPDAKRALEQLKSEGRGIMPEDGA